MTKITSLEIYLDMKEEIQEHGRFILYLQEELDTTEYYYRRWKHSVKEVAVENETSKLYYLYS